MNVNSYSRKGVTDVKGSYNSTQGKIVSEWKRTGDKLYMHVVVPPNTTAAIHIPARETEGGKPLDKAKGIKSRGRNGSFTVVEAGSGAYRFTLMLASRRPEL